MALITDKMVFVHVPRTGGHFVRSVVKDLGIPSQESGPPTLPNIVGFHQQAMEIDWNIRENRFSFAFVRHPITWLASRWWCEAQRGDHPEGDPQSVRGQMNASYHKFLDNVVNKCPEIPSIEMLGITTGVDKVYKYEMLIQSIIAALTEAGYDVPKHFIAKLVTRPNEYSRPPGMISCVSPRQREILMDANKEFCQLFEYA
jgi:hypothetical protein